MPTATAESGSRAAEKKFDAAKHMDGLRAELRPFKPEEVSHEELSADDARDKLEELRTEATGEKLAEADSARERIKAIHGDLEGELKDALKSAIESDVSLKALKSEKSTSATTRRRTERAALRTLEDGDLEGLIDEATVESVYAKLKDISPARLREVAERLASDLGEEYNFGDGIDGADVLLGDLENHFGSIAKKMDEVRELDKKTKTDYLEKRQQATDQFKQARSDIHELRTEKKAGAADITALKNNIDGTYAAASGIDKLIHKSDKPVSRRTFKDPETGAKIIELVYKISDADGNNSQKEAVVEYWNASKDGGELIKSTYVKVDKETKQRRFSRFRKEENKTKEVESSVLKVRKFPFGKYEFDLSKNARKELNPITSDQINASRRNEPTVDGLKKYKATAARMSGRMGHNMGMSTDVAKKASRLGKRQPVGFFKSLYDGMFNRSSKISRKG